MMSIQNQSIPQEISSDTSSNQTEIKMEDSSNEKVIIEDPRSIGYTWAFVYKNHNPQITIGPHCTIIRAFNFVPVSSFANR